MSLGSACLPCLKGGGPRQRLRDSFTHISMYSQTPEKVKKAEKGLCGPSLPFAVSLKRTDLCVLLYYELTVVITASTAYSVSSLELAAL
jgi:hypothetical protein